MKRKDQEKEQALHLRKQGKSYSAIKEQLGVSKSTLSVWLRDFPLSEEQIKKLRDTSPARIEKYRNTMRLKREARLRKAYENAASDIGILSTRDLFIGGLFLYWAEGTKVGDTQNALANTDPAVLEFFLRWLELLGVSRTKVKVRLHLYKDMDEQKEILFWANQLGLKQRQFWRSYIKDSRLSDVQYRKGGFGHGTCNVVYGNRELNDYILEGIKYISNMTASDNRP